MTYLSRVELERTPKVIRALGDLDQLHKLVMRAFPATDRAQPRAAFGVLFRLETNRTDANLIVQSHIPPAWNSLPDAVRRHETKSVDEALDAVIDGSALRFLLVANASRKRVKPDAGNSPRVGLRTDDDRHAWLRARGERDGFALDGSGPHDGVRISVVSGRRQRGTEVHTVRFEGRLRVRDSTGFRAAIEQGIGPAKAYGCGLLSVRPG